MSQRNNPERYSRQGKNDLQEQYSASHRKWGWSRARRTNDADATATPQITSVASVNALPSSRSASLTNAASPAERMAAARYAGAPPLPQRAPDDVPALSTARKMGSALQRFSGTGVASTSAVQRQEQRARVITLSLVSVAVVLVVVSAFLLFNPAVRHPGFGLAQGQSYVTVTSSAVVTLYKSPTPRPATPTPAPGSQPKATATSQPKATATPRPTATTTPRPTPTITPTPTATPIPFGAGATVTFTAATKPLASDGNITACPGCGGSQINDKPFGTQAYFSHGGSTQYAYSTYSYTESVTLVSSSNLDTCLKVPCIYVGHPTLSVGGETCLDGGEGVHLNNADNFTQTVTCVNNPYATYEDFASACPSIYAPTTIIGCTTNSTKNTTNYYVVTFAACLSARQNADAQGDTWANNLIASQSAGLSLVASSIVHNPENCNPGVGIDLANVYSFTGSNTTTVSGLAYNPAEAQAQASQRINSMVPAGYKPGSIQVCSPTVLSYSGNTIQISCSDSETAVYDWTQAVQAQLQAKLTSSGSNLVTQAQAESLCNGFPGVTPGSCTIVINKGSYMPTAGNAIALVIK